MTLTTFLGLFFILAGLGYLAKIIFKFELNMTRYFVGVFLVLIGVHFLIKQLGGSYEKKHHNTWFSSEHFSVTHQGDNEYTVVFGESTIDLSDYKLNQSEPQLDISVVFANARIILPDSVHYRIVNNVAFGHVESYSGDDRSFGEFYVHSPGFDTAQNFVLIQADVVFGNLEWVKR